MQKRQPVNAPPHQPSAPHTAPRAQPAQPLDSPCTYLHQGPCRNGPDGGEKRGRKAQERAGVFPVQLVQGVEVEVLLHQVRRLFDTRVVHKRLEVRPFLAHAHQPHAEGNLRLREEKGGIE